MASKRASSSATDQKEQPRRKQTWWELIRETYFTVDRRTLGVTRLALGFLLLTDLFRRTGDWEAMYSTEGVLPNHFTLYRPQARGAFSIFEAFSTPGELWVLWVLMLVTFVGLFVGYKTKVWQILAVFLVAGMNGRVLLIENGGYVVNNLLLMWTAFLPLGDRFSVDSVLASMRRRKEGSAAELNERVDLMEPFRRAPHVSLAVFAILIQLAAIYYFNVVHKTGHLWRNGTAVHYVMYVDRMVTPLIGAVRDSIPWFAYYVMTKSVIAAEAALPVCLLTPLGRVWARRFVIVLIAFLHIGFGSTFVLGPFAWSLCVFATLMITREDWELAYRLMRRPHRARFVYFDPASKLALLLCRVLVRLDHFRLLRFKERPGIEGGFATRPPGGPLEARQDAVAAAVAALPMGPSIAWLFAVPGPGHLTRAWSAGLSSGSLDRFFGSARPMTRTDSPAPPAPLRRKLGWGVITLREVAVLVMMAGAVNQGLVEMWAINRRWKVPQPEETRVLAHKMRYLQGWFMFSPEPVTDDGTVVVDAVTVDGRHIDPITGKPPNYDLHGARSFGYSQIWSDYLHRIGKKQNRPYHDKFRDFLLRYHERTGNPNDELVSGSVYWIADNNPRWGTHASYGFRKEHLFSFGERKLETKAKPPQHLAPRPAIPRGPRERLPPPGEAPAQLPAPAVAEPD